MRKFTLLGAVAGLALSVLTGCSQNAMTVRGQAPMDSQSMPGLTPESQMYSNPPQTVSAGGMPYGMPGDPTAAGAASNWMGNGWAEGGPNAPMPGYEQGQGGGYGYERSYKFKYKEPRDLRYPPVGDVPAVVQYPYYTFKGPDDFFHQ